MPQFDLFIWVALSFWTIFFFQIIYYILLFYIIVPFSNLQKTLIKLYIYKQKNITQNTKLLNFVETYSLFKLNIKF